MKNRYFILFVLLALVSTTNAQTISRKVISNAGGTLRGGNSQITFTLGETFIPSLNSATAVITQGFQQPGEQVRTGSVATSICAGSSFSLPYTATDIGGGNTFTVQLSNAAGSFASPVNIGTLAGNASAAVINVTIPSNTIAGTGYRIRITSSSPAFIGSDNGANITINAVPVAVAQPVTIYLDAAGAASVAAAQVNNGSANSCGIKSLALSKTAFTCANLGANPVVLTVTDNNGNVSTANAVVTVVDNTIPVITCTTNQTVNVNNTGCTYKQADSGWDATASDNCSNTGVHFAYTLSGATTSLNTYTTLKNVSFNVGVTKVAVIAYDASNNASTTCNFNVTVAKTLAVTVTNSNPQLYYGYTLDQSSIIKGTPSGGVGPYKVVITMSNLDSTARILNCNLVSSSGDESWSASLGGTVVSATSTSVGNTCPASGNGITPISTAINVPVGGSYSVTATLMSNARFTVTVTDANGCSVSKTTDVYSEDDRCFAGNSGNAKVKICHRTGNSNDPCHELCVDQSAVAAHLAHGDYIGSCLPLCATPTIHTKVVITEKKSDELTEFEVIAYPNPTDHQFNLIIKGGSDEKVEVLVYDSLGRMVKHIDNSDGQQIKFGEGLPTGTYIAIISQGINQKTVRLIKQ
jgi:hypothetical protein